MSRYPGGKDAVFWFSGFYYRVLPKTILTIASSGFRCSFWLVGFGAAPEINCFLHLTDLLPKYKVDLWREALKNLLKMRRLNRKKTLNLMKELDAFPKVPESYIETSTSGGTGKALLFSSCLLWLWWLPNLILKVKITFNPLVLVWKKKYWGKLSHWVQWLILACETNHYPSGMLEAIR